MKVNLKIENGNTTETEQHEVKKINVFQLQGFFKTIKEIIVIVQNDEALRGIFEDFANGANADTEVTPQFVATRIAGAFEAVLINIPEKAFELLSILSGIEKKTLMNQPVEDAFDIYDAVIEVNDIERLWARAKKSFGATKSAMAFMRKVEKATGQAQA
ncbi:hypothetical protein [Oceanobacillus sojae]|uniref:hypothetical protein n=1 Tax=Oceanobacillus sojae TaxID=582851 RepID=UPI0012ECE9F4